MMKYIMGGYPHLAFS